MKIGEFSKQCGLSSNTIRYYIDKGLIIPEKSSQYTFDQQCLDDVAAIRKLKNQHFTLDEIHQILSLVRNIDDPSHAKMLLLESIYVDKIQEIDGLIEQYKYEKASLEKDLAAFNPGERAERTCGIHLSSLSLLCCPKCGHDFELSGASIVDYRVVSGLLQCSCGYHSEIRNGIIITEVEEGIDTLINYHVENVLLDYVQLISSHMSDLHFKAERWCRKNIPEVSHGDVALTLGEYSHLAWNFAKTDAEISNMHMVYYIPSFEKAMNIQSSMKHLNIQLKEIIIVGNSFDMPIKPNTVDLFFDNYSNYNHLFYYPDFAFSKIKGYLKDKAGLHGIFVELQNCPKSLANIESRYANSDTKQFRFAALKKHLKAARMDLINHCLVGEDPNPGGLFDFHQGDEPIKIFAYHATNQR